MVMAIKFKISPFALAWFVAGLCLMCSFGIQAQKEITLEDIWSKGTFNPKYIPGFAFQGSGREYLKLNQNQIERYDLLSGEKTGILMDGSDFKDLKGQKLNFTSYIISPNERYILIETQSENIYRYSKKAFYYLWDSQKNTLIPLHATQKQMYPTFSPDSEKIAFVSSNNLYVLYISSGRLLPITKDGKANHIINGASDWVYEEEFTLTRAYEWSPNSEYIAYLKFDEFEVPTFTLEWHRDELYPIREDYKYPKVGEKNAKVTLHLYHLQRKKSRDITPLGIGEQYLPRIKWSPKGLIAHAMNRHQNLLQLWLINPKTGKSGILLEERNEYYIDIHDDLTILPDDSGFIWSSEKDGFQHLYLYDWSGNSIRPLTYGLYDVTAFYGLDAKNGYIYFQAAKESPLERHIYRVGLSGAEPQKISPESGWNTAQFSPDFEYFVNTNSGINRPTTYKVLSNQGHPIKTLEDNDRLTKLMEEYGVSNAEFFQCRARDGIELNGYIIKPRDFDPNKKYPLFMFLYGGPNSQQATDSWKSSNYWWFQMLAQKGYVIACVDNRGTGGRGESFRKVTYLQLGHYETLDQIDAAKYLGSFDWIDADRIGIFGWSYGGYMSSLCILKGAEVFKLAIAVAPVTNWKWYDTIYTERYMRTEKENPEGYRQNSPVYFADRLNGKYLLIHGMADDNVHFQHAVEMANALIKANKQFDTYYYPNKNHGIYGGNTRLHLYTKMTQFILDNL